MEYVRFGNAGIRVSRICLGAMNFPTELEEKDAIALVHHALDQGINFIDTADGYGHGRSEELLGKALKGGKREHVVLATKFWVRMYRDDPNGGGCSRYHIIRAVEDSLRRLDMDHIDLIQLHHPHEDTPVEEVLSTLDALVKQGKIRYVGVSNHYAWQMAHMLGVAALHNWEPLVSIQCRYSILDRVVENETVPFCQRFNIAMMAYSPVEGGVLTGKYKRGQPLPEDSRVARIKQMQRRLDDRTFDVLEELERIAAKYEITMAQLAVAWCLAKPYCTTPIVGGRKPEHFEPLYDCCDIRLDEDDVKHIDDISDWTKYRPFVNQPIVQGPELALNRW
ncbi:MAG: aldo/keto reductase [Armatimonadota bacterium]